MRSLDPCGRCAWFLFLVLLFLGPIPAAAKEPLPGGRAAAASFLRGDVDGRPGHGLGDPLVILDGLVGDRPLPCLDAADTDDDGALGLSDAVRLLRHLFQGGPPPAPPVGACGTDPTPDALGCAASAACEALADPAREELAGAGLDLSPAGPRLEEGVEPEDPDVASTLARVTSRESTALPPGPRDARGGGGRILAPGDIAGGEILSTSQVDSYVFTAAHGQSIVADRLAATSAQGLNWRLVDAHGRVLAQNPVSLDDLDPMTLLGGTYTLSVFAEGNGTGAYQFRLVDATPRERRIELDEEVAGEIDADHTGQRHDFVFDAAAGTTVLLDHLLTGVTTLDWWLEDARGRVLVVRAGLADRGPVALLAGAHRLSIAGRRSGGNLLAGAYHFRLVDVPSPAPRAIALGEVVLDGIQVPGEQDTFTFSTAPGQVVFLDHLSPAIAANFNWELVDAVGRAVIARTSSLGDAGPLPLTGGEYTLRVLGEGGAAGDYSFRVVDATPSRTSIAIGAEVAGEIPAARPGTVNTHEFTAPPARLITIENLGTSNLGGLDWLLEDALGRTVLVRTNSLSTTGPIALAGGDYRLLVLGEGQATGTYRFRIRDDGPATPGVPGAAAAIGDVIEGVLPAGGEARYTFAAAGQMVFLDLLAGDANLDWELADAVGRILVTKRANTPDATSDIGPYPLAAGDHTVVLRARAATAAPPYRFQIADASPVTRNAAIGDVLSGGFAGAPGVVHRYRFTVAGSAAPVFLDKLDASSRLDWALLDPGDQPVFLLRNADSVDDDTGPFSLAAGTYTLVLDPEGGHQPSYEIALRSTSDTEDAVALGQTISGDFAGRAGSTRTVLLEVPVDGRLFIDRLTFTQRLSASLIDPAGTPVLGLTQLTSGGTLGPFAVGAGTYRLLLDPPTAHEPAYELRAALTADPEVALAIGAPVAGSLGSGGTAAYSFTAGEGQRFLFDLITGATSLRWSLVDEFGQAVFLDAVASTATADQGPLSLAAGDYRLVLDATAANTPSYAFTASLLAVDLAVSEFTAEPRVVFASDPVRAVEVTWTVENLGGGPAPTGAWTDRLVASTDATLGNADDVLLGEFVRFDTLAPRSSYSRRETVRLPAGLGLGQHRLFVAVDAGNVHPEAGGETDNVARLEVAVVGDLPPAEPLFVTTTSFPFDYTAEGVGHVLDLPLSRPVMLDSVRFVLAEACNIQLIPSGGLSAESELTLSLLNGEDEVLEIASAHPSGGGLSTFAIRFSRRLTPQVLALLPVRTVDGVRIRFDQSSTTTARLRSTHGDGRLRLHFTGCEFAPCGPHLERRSPGGESITVQGTEISPWRVVNFDEAVPGDGLRLVSGPRFSGSTTGSIFSLAFTSSEAQLILDDGALVTLDDSRSPSELRNPAVSLSVDHSLLLPPGALAGRRILGFQWRVHGASTGGAQGIYTPRDDQAIRFLYEVEACGGAIDVPPVTLEPADGSAFAPGSAVVLSGRAISPQPGREVSAVLVNGEPVDSLDAAGRFFKSVRIAEGENLFAIQVVEPGCGEPEALLRLLGLPEGTSGLSGYAEATAQLRVEYADTTFQRAGDSLVVRARARNASTLPVRGPILMVITDRGHPTLTLAGPAGITDDGEPFTVLFESGFLAPGEAGPWVPLVFSNPERRPVRYGVRWLAPADRPPHFESAPPATASPGREYRYAPVAADPDGDTVAFELERAPAGMVLTAGVLRWTPGPGDLGAHDVAITAVTSLTRVTQRWTLAVSEAAPNRPPFFTSAPLTQAGVGASYAYDADAVDPDGDPVAFALVEGPAGMAVGASDGRVAWSFALPGEHRVVLSAADGEGGEAVQSFLVAAGTLPSNPSAPRITSAPGTEARPGILWLYQPVASDPDGDLLSFRLEEGPAGMTIDERGRVAWTAALGQEGTHAVSLVVDDGRGGETRQRFAILVRSGDFNLPPVIESTPGGFALAGALYRYDVEAIDPENEPLRFALAVGPAGMAIDPATGRLAWTPPAGAAGSHVVSVEAVDPRGASGRQAFELRVRTANAAPRITSAPPAAQLTAGRIYQHDIEAEDPDGDLLRHELAAGPAAIEVHPVTGLVTWRTGPGDVGSHTATVRVADCCGGEAEAAFTIEVTPDVTPPALSIGFPTSPAPVGAIVEAWVSASDDVAVVSRTLTVECPPDAPRELTLDVIGRAQFASARTGYCTFRATATDPSGNVATATAVLQVGNPEDPLDPHPPVVQVLTPAPGSIITAPTSVAATISDATEDGKPGSGVLSWTVEIAPALSAMTTPGGGGGGGTPAGSEFRELGRGAGETLNAFLATFDPTMLPNGVYRLRIVASDGVQTGGVEYQVSVAGELKLGQFTFDAADLVASLAGLPIVISRRYDSLDSRSGDFGAGWRLAHPGEVEDSALELRTGNGLVDLLGTEPMKAGARVYVTRPDGRRIGFTFKPQALGGFLAMLHVATFEADQGVRDRLEVVEPAGHFFVIAGIASQVGVPYNPTVYRLTTEEGVSYLIDERAGLERMEDRNGNGIDVTPGGLFSALGPAVIFARDAAGRITRVVESGLTNPAEVTYAYDTGGNLVGATDVLGNETRYHYEESRFPHYLTRIDDPLGRPMLRNAYDDEGRLVGICGAGGDLLTLAGCTVIAWEPGTRASTMTDSRGFRIDRVFDERGRQLLERRYLDATRFLESRSEYDADGNLLRDVDASGEEWTYEYDAGGQQIVRRDPLGGTLVTTWDACGEPASDTGPDGSTVRFRYDASCNRIAIEEATGGEFSFAYDTYGDQTEVTDPVGNSWRFEYDGNGGLSKVVDPRGGSYLTQTGSGGDLLSRIDPDGRRADYVYDDAHRLVRETWNTVPPRVFTYEYDAAGQLVHATDGESSIRRDYLPTGRCSRVVTEGPAGAPEVSIDYQYDAGGNVTRVADSLGGITVTEYDGASRLLSIRQSGTGVREKRADFTWSNGSSAIEVRRFADLAGTVPVASTSFAYDCESCEDGPVSILHRRSADGSVIHQLEIERDPAGVVVAMTDAEGRHEYAHDAGMRLLHAVHPAGGIQPEEFYEYDAAGNRTASHRGSCVHAYTTAAGGNELQSDGVHRYETDGAGNVKRRIDLTTGASTEFRYDHRYRLTDVIERNPAGVETGRSSYAYDAMDNRVRATENGSVTHIVHDGRNPFLVLDGSGRVRTRRLYTRALDGVLADETGGVTRWFLTDHLGTIRDVVGDDGRTSAHLVYDSFGVLLQGSLAGPAGGLGFTAREYSEATGLYTLRAREYDPELGRFLRRDLLAPFQYDYAVSSPLSFVDPNGLAGRRPRPIDRPPWRRPPPPIRTPPRDFGPGYIPGYSHKWGPQGPGTYRTREPRGHGGGVLAEYATLLDSIAVPAILGGGFVTVAGATGVALAGAAAAVVFSSNIGL